MARKNREQSDKERLEKLVRELKSENRQLKKRLGRLTKGYRKYLDKDDTIEEENSPIITKKLCYDCNGELIKIEMLGRSWRICNGCGKRTTTKYI